MDFEIPSELCAFVETVKQFREREMMSLERQFLLDGDWTHEVRNGLEKRARDLGFWALDVPEEFGGQGLGALAMCLVAEELYKHPAMFEFGGSPEAALYMCNDEQRERYFLPVVRGERRSAYAFTEPGTGSDLGAIRTTAVADGDEYIINGRKTFISHVDQADFLILFASTDPSKKSKGVTCFLVDTDTEGYELSRPIETMGDGWTPYEISFSDCRVPKANVIGRTDEGWAIANHQLSHGRLRIAAYQLGIAQRALDLAVDWAKSRSTWGKPIGSRQAIQFMLADSYVELEAARLLVYRAAWMFDQGIATRQEAFVAKLYATEMSGRVTDRALQVFGGLGYTKEVPVQSLYRQARLWRIGHGTALTLEDAYDRARNYVGSNQWVDVGSINERDTQRFAATVGDLAPEYFDPDAAQRAGYESLAVPPLYLTAVLNWGWGPPESELLADGNARTPLAGVPLDGLRLMGAGQRLEYLTSARVGMRVNMQSSVEGVSLKEGRSGPLLLLTVSRSFRDESGSPLLTCIETFVARDVYVEASTQSSIPVPRDVTSRTGPVTPVAAPDEVQVGMSLGELVVSATPASLFRFSAVTWNAHRVHYDAPYAATEGYPERLVHSHLHGAWLARLVTGWAGPAGRLQSFSWQNRKFAVSGTPLCCSGTIVGIDGEMIECELCETDPEGSVCTIGHAVVRLPRTGRTL